MDDQLTPDLEARLSAWLATRAPMEVPTSFANRITSIPRSTPSARPSRLALAPNGRRWRSALLLAAAVTTALALLGGSFSLLPSWTRW
jgi:hypothetical protein